MRSLFVPVTRAELARRKVMVRVGKLQVISRLFIRWQEKAGRMKETDFAHPDFARFGPARPAHERA